MEMQAVLRDLNEKAKDIRSSGYVPGVLIGKELTTPIPIQIKHLSLLRFLNSDAKTQPVSLHIHGEVRECVLRDVQYDTLTERLIHVDFEYLG